MNDLSNKRIEWIDIAKAVAMILVIIGHSPGLNVLTYRYIVSVHLPVFFIASGFTSRPAENAKELKAHAVKILKKVFLPAWFLFTVKYFLVWHIGDLGSFENISSVIKEWIKSSVMFSCIDYHFLKTEYKAVGIIWYISAYCGLRILYDAVEYFFFCLKKKGSLKIIPSDKKEYYADLFHLLAVVCITAFGVIISDITVLPLQIHTSLACFILVYVGRKLKNADFMRLYVFIIMAVLWIPAVNAYVMVTGEILLFSHGIYPYFPVCYFGAVAGTVTIFYISHLLEKVRVLSAPLKFIGKNTLIIYFVHYFDDVWFYRLSEVIGEVHISALIRTAADLAVAALIIAVLSAAKNKKAVKEV